MSNVEWLLREAMDERTLRINQRAVIDDAKWRATIERIDIGAGLRVFLTDAEAHQDITVEARDDRTDRWLGSQVTISGGAEIDFLDGQQAKASADHAVLFQAPNRRAAYALKAGTKFHSAGYGLNVERTTRLFDGDIPAVLRPLLESDLDESRITVMRSDRLMRRLARSLFARRFNGPLRRLAMEGVVIQLLAAQIAAAEQTPCRQPCELSGRERHAIHDAHDRLLADMRRPPSLGELAAATGLSEKRLNVGFRALFGATVFEVLKNERLEHARIAFSSGTLPLKEIAFRVGYNHVSNFVNAFTARYGAPPRQYLGRGEPMADVSTAPPLRQSPSRRPA